MNYAKLNAIVNIDFLPNGGTAETVEYSNVNNMTVPQSYSALLKSKDKFLVDNVKRIYLDGSPCFEGKLGEQSKYHFWDSEPYDGFNSFSVSQETANQTGYQFEKDIPQIIVKAQDNQPINCLVIWFDSKYGEYATQIAYSADGNHYTITDNHRIFKVLNVPEAAEVTVKFLAWNKPGRCAKVYRINTSFNRDFDFKRIVNLTASAEDRPDPGKVEYGLSSQYGSLELVDVDSEFEILNEYELLQDNQPITVNIIKDNVKFPIGSYLSQDWELKPNDNTIKVDFTDVISRLQNIDMEEVTIRKFNYMLSADSKNFLESYNVTDVIKKLLEICGLNIELILPNDITNIISSNFYFDNGTVFDNLKKILCYCKCRLYIADNKIIVSKI